MGSFYARTLGSCAGSAIASGVRRGRRVAPAAHRQPTRERSRGLALVVCPELERLALGFRGQDLGRRDVNGVECAHVDDERALRAIDDGRINRAEVHHRQQIRQLLSLDCGLGIIESADETFAIDGTERFDLEKP